MADKRIIVVTDTTGNNWDIAEEDLQETEKEKPKKKLTKKQLDEKVLEIISVQHPDYLIQPTASAFVIEDLAPGEVEQSLYRLLKAGQIDHITTTLVEDNEDGEEVQVLENGKPVVLNHGFKLPSK